MNNQMIQYVFNSHLTDNFSDAEKFGGEQSKQVRAFHESLPGYVPTELCSLPALSNVLGVHSLFVKDESSRFGLNAFKVLGGSYCIGRLIGQIANIPIDELSFDRLQKEKMKDLEVVTATDGNHGRGIAWACRQFGIRSHVYMPKGSSKERLNHIAGLGAEAEIIDMNYDDAVRFAAKCEKEKGWILVQDTAWDGYEDIPSWIMQGYTTMALEITEQLGDILPTHIFLQAGVGAMSGAITSFFTDYYKERKPKIIIVEPNGANCLFQTAMAGDGTLHHVKDLDTIMAGLSCGEPCTIGWNQLNKYADAFISVPDEIAALGMRVLGNPAGTDSRIISGESGAVTTGLVAQIMTDETLRNLKEKLNLGKNSNILCISTEGDTDQKSYRDIVWNGAYPNMKKN